MTGETKGGIVDGLMQRSIDHAAVADRPVPGMVTRAFVVSWPSSPWWRAPVRPPPPRRSPPPSTTPTTSGTTASTTAGTPSPGVTATSVTVGQVDDLTSPIAGSVQGGRGRHPGLLRLHQQPGRGERAHDQARRPGQCLQRRHRGQRHQRPDQERLRPRRRLLARRRGRGAARRRRPACPTSPIRSTPTSANLPNSYSPAPNNDSDYPLTIFKVLKEKFPRQIKHVGILWANATPSTATAEKSFERATKSQGFKIVYDHGFTPSQTTFLPNVLTMKSKGVQMFFTTAAARLRTPPPWPRRCSSRTSRPIDVEGDAYSANLIKDGGAAVNNMYIEIGYVLYLGHRRQPAGGEALRQVDEQGRLQRRTSRSSRSTDGPRPSCSSRRLQRRREPAHPGRARGGAGQDHQLQRQRTALAGESGAEHPAATAWCSPRSRTVTIVRVAPTPATGFICSPGGLLPAPGYKPEVRPAPSS